MGGTHCAARNAQRATRNTHSARGKKRGGEGGRGIRRREVDNAGGERGEAGMPRQTMEALLGGRTMLKIYKGVSWHLSPAMVGGGMDGRGWGECIRWRVSHAKRETQPTIC